MVGFETADDAGVYKLDSKLALIQTVDFFPPIVDTPYLFGQIAAANAMSDVYAMGGRPLTAMNLVAFPCGTLSQDVLAEILRGGAEKIKEAGAVVVGGHSIEDKEPKYGLAVSGLVEIEKLVTNAKAKVGDRLVLTKPLGMGILATALKGGEVSEEEIMSAIETAATLNEKAAEVMKKIGVNACTDVTGFGLLGHLKVLLDASGVGAQIRAKDVPIWSQAVSLAEIGLIPEGCYHNEEYLKDSVKLGSLESSLKSIFFDPQTSGGLLISVSKQRSDGLVNALKQTGLDTHAVIGEIVPRAEEISVIEIV